MRTVTETALALGFTSRMNVLKKLLVAPSARYHVVCGAWTPPALWPPRRPFQYMVRSTKIGTPLALVSTIADVSPVASPGTRLTGSVVRRRGGMAIGMSTAVAVAIDADDAGRGLIGRVDGQDLFLEERPGRAFREIPARLLRAGERGSGEQGQGHRRTLNVQPLHVVDLELGGVPSGRQSLTSARSDGVSVPASRNVRAGCTRFWTVLSWETCGRAAPRKLTVPKGRPVYSFGCGRRCTS